MRRLVPAIVTVLFAALVAGGCANAANREAPAAASPSAPAEAAFPVTVEHKYGSTVVEAKPVRVVSVGLTEQDILLQLGVVPIAVAPWFAEQPYATWPWARDLLGDAKPVVLDTADGVPFEKIAELAPDLIVGTNSGMTKADYAKLSKIAPTVTGPTGSLDYFSPWDEQTLQIAKALGQEARGQQIVEQTKAAFAQVRAEHPEFAGKTATFSQGAPYEGKLYVYPDGLSTQFLTEMGFRITPGLEKYVPKAGSQAEISAEVVDVVEADVVVFATENAGMFDELQKWATIKNLGAVKENRSVYTDSVLAGAIYFMTPLSLDYVAKTLAPKLATALEGKAAKQFAN